MFHVDFASPMHFSEETSDIRIGFFFSPMLSNLARVACMPRELYVLLALISYFKITFEQRELRICRNSFHHMVGIWS